MVSEEQHVDLQVQQVGHGEEHPPLQLGERVEEEVHRPVAGVVADRREPVDEHPLGDPLAAGELGQRPARQPVGDHREDHPLDQFGVHAAALRGGTDRRADPQPLPQPVDDPRAAHRPGVHHRRDALAAVPARLRRQRLAGLQEAADAGDQPRQRRPVDPIGAPEVVHDPRLGHARVRVPLVVGQRQVGHHRPVSVPSLRLP